MITAANIAIIVANFVPIIPVNIIYIAYEQIAIIAVDIIGFITKLLQSKFNFTFFFKTANAIKNATK